MVYKYVALTAADRKVKGRIDVPDEEAALQLLERAGLHPVSVKAVYWDLSRVLRQIQSHNKGLVRAWVITTIFFGVLALAPLVLGGVLNTLGYNTFIMYSGSMAPTLDAGSVAVAREVETERLVIGDIIAYDPEGGPPTDSRIPLIHRVMKIDRSGDNTVFTMKGDANELPDPQKVIFPDTAYRIAFGVPYLGYIYSIYSATWLPYLLIIGMATFTIGLIGYRASSSRTEIGASVKLGSAT